VLGEDLIGVECHLGVAWVEIVDDIGDVEAGVVVRGDKVGVFDDAAEGDVRVEVVDPVKVAEAAFEQQDQAAGADVLDAARVLCERGLGGVEDLAERAEVAGPRDAVELLVTGVGLHAEAAGTESS
jgi:hypothetical protein